MRFATVSLVTGLLLLASCGRQAETSEAALVDDRSGDLESAPLLQGSLIRFGDPLYRSHLRYGWSYDETSPDGAQTWVWAEGRVAEVEVLATSEPGGEQAVLSFRCWPLHYLGGPEQTVTVTLDGNPLGSLELEPEPREYELAVPTSLTRAGRRTIRFEFAYAEEPRHVQQGSSDPRPLSVAFSQLRLGPAATAQTNAAPATRAADLITASSQAPSDSPRPAN